MHRQQQASPRRIPCSKKPTTTQRFRPLSRISQQPVLRGRELRCPWWRRCPLPPFPLLLTLSRPTIVACDPSPLPTELSPADEKKYGRLWTPAATTCHMSFLPRRQDACKHNRFPVEYTANLNDVYEAIAACAAIIVLFLEIIDWMSNSR